MPGASVPFRVRAIAPRPEPVTPDPFIADLPARELGPPLPPPTRDAS